MGSAGGPAGSEGGPDTGDDGDRVAVPPSAGLCASCLHPRVIRNRRGSVFVLCGRSRDDPRFPRYPPLPVLACPGYEPAGRRGDAQ